MLVDVVQVGATTKKDLRERLTSDPASVRFVPAVVSNPLALAFNTTADRLPGTPHSAVVHGTRWTATVTFTRDGFKIR